MARIPTPPGARTPARLLLGCLLLTAMPTAPCLMAPCLMAQSHIGHWNAAVHERWWNEHPDAGQWTAKREVIHRELQDVFERMTPATAFANAPFTGWTNHLKWLSLLPVDPELHASFVKLALDDKLRTLFLDSLSPYDDQAEATAILCRIHRAHPREITRYPELAIALSLVFDQPFPDGWPHHFVNPSSLLRAGEPPEQRFAFYIHSHRNDRLITDPSRLTVDQLKFVIDTPVPLEELNHLQGVRMRSLRQLQWLFQAIPYNRGRIQRDQLVWPHGPYRVFTIQEFWQDWVRNFAHQDDLRFRGEQRLLIALEEAGETLRYQRLFDQVVGNHRGGRFDLATSLSAERVFALIESGRWEQADSAFDGALARLRTRAGGHLFYQLIQPYVQTCLEQGRIDQAAQALDRSIRTFRAQSGSILDRDLADIKRLVEARASSG